MSSCCELLGISPQAYYKRLRRAQRLALRDEMVLRHVMAIRREMPLLGGRKLQHMLLSVLPGEFRLGRDALFRLLDRHGLLIRSRCKRRAVTTNSYHHFHKYPNLYKGRVPENPEQVWVSDITYLACQDGHFIYLSLITDACSHRIMGWDLSESLALDGAVRALRMALGEVPSARGIMHHSDRGIQYCSNEYTRLLQENGMLISMTENGDPLENAVAERVNGILKEEWLNREHILSAEDGRSTLERVIATYNGKRPHMSIGMITPDMAHRQGGPFRRKWKTYYKNKQKQRI